MGHQTREEESNQQGRFELDRRLIRGGRLHESEEEQKGADEQHRIVRFHHDKDQEADMHENDPGGRIEGEAVVTVSPGLLRRQRGRNLLLGGTRQGMPRWRAQRPPALSIRSVRP